MKLCLQHQNLPTSDKLNAWVEQQVLELARTRQIDTANIRLAHLHEKSPAYQVNVHLVTPGPDVFAEGRDHTIRAAFGKVMRRLREQIVRRTRKMIQRVKTKVSAPLGRKRCTVFP